MRTMTKATGVPRPVPRFLLAHLRWILFVAFVVTAGAAAFSWSREPMYQSQVDVLVEPHVTSQVAAPQPPDMGTEKAIASSGVVLAMASSALHVPTHELYVGLSVTVPVDTHVLQVTYTGRNPREASRRAQGLADAYIAFQARQQPGVPANAGQSDKSKTNLAAGTVQGIIITPAAVPGSPATPNHMVDITVALIVGLGLGVATAMVRDRFDDRLRGPDDFEAQAGAPVLALIPAFRSARGDPAGRLVMLRSRRSLVADAYRNLRTLLLLTATRKGAKTILITSPAGRETPTTAANLAVALAQSGRHVVLLCADLRAPQMHRVFDVDNEVGLTAVVDGRRTLSQAIVATEVERLSLLPTGAPTDDPGAVLQAPALQTVLNALRQSADIVVVEAPPVLAGAEARVLTDLVEMVLLVVDSRRSTRSQARAAVRQLEQVREKLVGCALVNVGRRRRRQLRPPAGFDSPTDTMYPPAPHTNGRFVGRVPSKTFSAEESAAN